MKPGRKFQFFGALALEIIAQSITRTADTLFNISLVIQFFQIVVKILSNLWCAKESDIGWGRNK